MTGSVAVSQARVYSRATSPADALNKLNLALDEIILSSSAVANGTSTVLDSAALASPSASVSAISSESAASAVESSGSEQSSFSASLASAVSKPLASVATASATSVTASQRITSTSAPETPAASPSTSSSSSEQPLNVPKNAAVTSTSSSAASTSSSAAATAKSATLDTNVASSLASPTSSSLSASSSSARPSTVSTSNSTNTPGTTSKASNTEAPVPSKSSSASSVAIISTQRAQISTSKALSPSSTDIQVVDSGSSGTTAGTVEQQPTTSASQHSDTSSSSAVQGTTPSSNSNSRDSQPPVTASSNADSTDNLGNSLLGVTSSSSNIRVGATLSTAKAISITSGSSTYTTAPAFITSISVSSGTDDSPQTFTSIFANPTTLSKSADLSDRTFWDNRGAVAGVFTVVTLASLAFLFGIFYCWRSRHQRLAHGSATNAQFHRFSGPSDMSQRPTTYQAVRGFNLTPPSYRDDPQRHLMVSSITSGLSNGHEDPASMQRSGSQVSRYSNDVHVGALGLTGVLANPSGNMQSYNGPFSDYHRYISTGDTRLSTPPEGLVGIALSSDFATETKSTREPEPAVEHRSPSPAPSSPSIYPPSLPPVPEKDEDDYLFYERETTRRSKSQFPSPPPKAVINDTDSRNPFASPLDSIHDAAPQQDVPPVHILTEQAYRPLTPPDSSPGCSPATPRFPGAMEPTKPLNPFSNAFLGRSVSARIEPLPRPMRSPLRLSASGSSLKNKESA